MRETGETETNILDRDAENFEEGLGLASEEELRQALRDIRRARVLETGAEESAVGSEGDFEKGLNSSSLEELKQGIRDIRLAHIAETEEKARKK